jgi:hypothetical protein
MEPFLNRQLQNLYLKRQIQPQSTTISTPKAAPEKTILSLFVGEKGSHLFFCSGLEMYLNRCSTDEGLGGHLLLVKSRKIFRQDCRHSPEERRPKKAKK